mmetsp:Transcript_76548/g.216442  ORF Transcript_76548/g.216442 Transcript_76548/m.216442 type:complete len:137 (+) Transcript_76548:958-1368(+)
MGTVGAVAIDQFGNIACATSTGGTPNKMPGRVGDSPLPGSGAYADRRHGGASTTGWGESIMRMQLARTAVDQAEYRGLAAGEACARAVARLGAAPVEGAGGVIMIDAAGNWGADYNTPYMARAVAVGGEGVIVCEV